MKNIWLTSDTHYGHSNIIKYSNRPFASVEEMNETLIQNWNSVVKLGDDVYHLGDFSWCEPGTILNRLSGTKMLILGNHDDYKEHEKTGKWAWIKNYYELKINGNVIILFHYPMRSWNKAFHGSYHAFGHVHGKLPDFGRSCDIGVDCFNYFPVNITEFIKKFENIPITHEEGD